MKLEFTREGGKREWTGIADTWSRNTWSKNTWSKNMWSKNIKK